MSKNVLTKITCIVFTKHRPCTNIFCYNNVYYNRINSIKYVKYLEIYLKDKLNFTSCVKYAANKVNKILSTTPCLTK